MMQILSWELKQIHDLLSEGYYVTRKYFHKYEDVIRYHTFG